MTDPHHELRSRRLSNRDWMRLTAIIPLPLAARKDIDRAIFVYRLMKQEKDAEPRPSELRERLLRVARIATAYADEVRDLDSVALRWLHECGGCYSSAASRDERDVEILKFTKDARHMADWLTYAASKVDEWEPTSAVHWLEGLVSALDRSLVEHTGSGVKRSNAPEKFVHAVCTLADASLGPGSIDSAMKKVTKAQRAARGKNAG